MSHHQQDQEAALKAEKQKLTLELGEAHLALAKASGDIKKIYRKLDELETKPK
jgi:hypothetical protein